MIASMSSWGSETMASRESGNAWSRGETQMSGERNVAKKWSLTGAVYRYCILTSRS